MYVCMYLLPKFLKIKKHEMKKRKNDKKYNLPFIHIKLASHSKGYTFVLPIVSQHMLAGPALIGRP